MNKELDLVTFKYFLECYFNVSVNYDELNSILNDFNTQENVKYRKKLRDELRSILQLGNWNIVQEIIKKYGMRKMDEEKAKWFIHSVFANLEVNY